MHYATVPKMLNALTLGCSLRAAPLRPGPPRADPFGTDSVDFDCEAFLKGAYLNAVAHLQSDARAPLTSTLPRAMDNPLDTGLDQLGLGGGKAARGRRAAFSPWGRPPAKVRRDEWPTKALMPAPPEASDSDVRIDMRSKRSNKGRKKAADDEQRVEEAQAESDPDDVADARGERDTTRQFM